MNDRPPALSDTLRRTVIVGCGYVGKRLAKALAPECEVLGVVRSEASVAALVATGTPGIAVNLDAPADRPFEWARGAEIVYLAPPPPEGESDPRLAEFLNHVPGRPSVFVYMSTTGVYGDTGGAEVTEQSLVNPQTPRARRRVNAEDMVRVWCTEREVRRVVLRVPGIYGPGRLPIERLQKGEQMLSEAEAGIGNRIHVDDLVAACTAALAQPDARGVYNITDGAPLNTTAFLLRLASITGLEAPPQISMDEAQLVLSASRLSFLNESRLVSNRRMLAHLGVRLRYADVEAGIRQSLAEEAAGLGSGS